jgi:hypothetical protein
MAKWLAIIHFDLLFCYIKAQLSDLKTNAKITISLGVPELYKQFDELSEHKQRGRFINAKRALGSVFS